MDEQIQYRNPVKSAGWATIYHAMTLDDRISAGAYRLLMVYEMHAQQKGTCFPGRARLAQMLNCSEPTISRYNGELESAGYITRQRRLGTSSMTYIEDYEQIPYLKEIASRITNNTIVGSNLIQQSDQICNVKNEQENKEQEKKPAPQAARFHQKDIEVELIDGKCSCWNCGEPLTLDDIPDSLCPACGEQLIVFELSGFGGKKKIIKKPEKQSAPGAQEYRQKPVDGFMALANKPIISERQRSQWAVIFHKLAQPYNATPEQVYQAIKAIPNSEHNWYTATDPHAKKFQEILDVMLARIIYGDTPQAKVIVIND